MSLLALTDIEQLLVVIIAGVLWCVILYNIIKYAIIAAMRHNKSPETKHERAISDVENLSPRQKELQKKYERGEISLDEYRREWNIQ